MRRYVPEGRGLAPVGKLINVRRKKVGETSFEN
jgi:hypothetical protein